MTTIKYTDLGAQHQTAFDEGERLTDQIEALKMRISELDKKRNEIVSGLFAELPEDTTSIAKDDGRTLNNRTVPKMPADRTAEIIQVAKHKKSVRDALDLVVDTINGNKVSRDTLTGTQIVSVLSHLPDQSSWRAVTGYVLLDTTYQWVLSRDAKKGIAAKRDEILRTATASEEVSE